ncbi:hypothetical protein MKX01_037030, partial [Papaver californicum]
ASRTLQEYLLHLVDTRERQLKSVVNEMYGIILRHDDTTKESLGREARIEALFDEFSTLRLLYEVDHFFLKQGKGASGSDE